MIKKFKKDYEFLSNFYKEEITVDGITYPTVEHAFQAQKFSTQAEKEKIAKYKKPSTAKKKGREPTLPKDWDKASLKHMNDILRIKFTNPKLKEMLISTGNEELIEGNDWHDNKWGNCTCGKCRNIEGKNLLGKFLMQIRDELKNS